MNRTVLFQHIPKTAGSTIYSILEKQYAAGERFRIDGMDPRASIELFKSLDNASRVRFRLIYGHLADHLLPFSGKAVTVTFLREPVDLFVSSYYYIKRAKQNRFHELAKTYRSIEEFIELRKTENLDNLQARHLAGETDFLLGEKSNPGPIDESVFHRAADRLAKMDFVMLTESFDESMLILRRRLGWKAMPYYSRKNATTARPGLSTFSVETLNKIRGLNHWDLKLYDIAVEKFNTLHELTRPDFLRELKRFQLLNKVLNQTRLIHFVKG